VGASWDDRLLQPSFYLMVAIVAIGGPWVVRSLMHPERRPRWFVLLVAAVLTVVACRVLVWWETLPPAEPTSAPRDAGGGAETSPR
jgi:hypothetical protein